MPPAAPPDPSIDSARRFLLATRALCAAAAAALFTLALRPAAHVYDMPLTEDGYYSLTVARNLAAGRGLTIDGVTLTNGFQPLFTMLEAMAFALSAGDDALAMRFVIVLAWLAHVMGALVVAQVARDAWSTLEVSGPAARHEQDLRAALAAFLYLAAPLMFNHAYNGLETACVAFFYAAAWRWAQIGRDRSWLGLAAFGALIGMMVLARIDAAFLALVLGLNELRRSVRRGFAVMLARGAMMGGVAVLVSSPWWIYNLVQFGSPMPTSGTAQQNWALEWLRFEHAEWALRVVLFPWLFAGAYEAWLSLDIAWPLSPAGYVTVTATGVARAAALVVACVALIGYLRRVAPAELAAAPRDAAERIGRSREFANCFLIAFAGLALYYMLSFVAYWFYYRYFFPLTLFAVLAAAIAGARFALRRSSVGARAVQYSVLAVLAIQLGALVILAQSGRGIAGNTVYHDQIALVRQYVPNDDFVAAGQSGTLGFFRDRVINADGKVNLPALAWQDRMWEYLRRRDVKWFVDWPHYVNKYLDVPLGPGDLPAAEANGWRRVAERNYFYLYEYVGDAPR